MKLFKYFSVLLISVVLLEACREDLPPESPFFIKEQAAFRFYNNGDSTLERMTLIAVIHDPADLPYATLDMLITSAKNSPIPCKRKTLSD